jgi:uncharacterized protein YggU (UPF0235/DUF167 family)
MCIAHAQLMSIFTPTAAGAACTVRVTPRAGRTAIAGVRDGQLVVKLAAAPVDGAANQALAETLARALDLPKRAVTIASGERSRTKRVAFAGVTPGALDARLAAILRG